MPRDPFNTVNYSIRLLDLLKEVPTVRLDVTRKKRGQLRQAQPGFSLELFAGKERWRLVGEVKSNGEPRMIRGAIQQLQSNLSTLPRAYGLIAAPYIGARSQEICKEAGVGYLDLAGDCRLAFGQVFIERRGFPNPKIERRPLRTLFAPKAGRVLRVLLEDPKRSWQVQAMARVAHVSLGLAFKVKQCLLEQEYAQEGKGGVRVIRPEELLRDWGASYTYGKNLALECYGAGAPFELEQVLVSYCMAQRINYAFTLFSGAARVAPLTRYVKGFAYVLGDPGEVADGVGWKPVPSGANFTLLKPFDEGVLYGKQEVDGETVVSDVQLYLDLAGYKGRGEEAATFVLEQRLRPRW
jgi:hypothetical protein